MDLSPHLTSLTPARGARRLWPWLRLLALLNLVTACGGGSSATETEPAAPAWTVLGSSSAAGMGANSGRSWVALLNQPATVLGSPIHNLARSGAVTFQALPAATTRPADRPATDPAMDIDQVLARAPGVLILAFPSNDTMAGYSSAETTANLLSLRSRALAARVAVVLVSSQPRNDASAAQQATMTDIDVALARQAGPCFVDVRSMLSGAGGKIASELSAGDGVHLNDAGHQRIYDQVAATIAGGRCVKLPAR